MLLLEFEVEFASEFIFKCGAQPHVTMELAVLLVTLTMFWKLPDQVSARLRCYQCEPDFVPSGVRSNLCQYFDGNEIYMTECLNSTMCFKKEVSMDFGNGVTTTGIRRGCAPQRLEDEQVLRNHHWYYVHKIYEVYKEECSELQDPDRPTKTTYCYCRGNLCNGGSEQIIQYGVISGTVFLVALFNMFS